MITFISEIQKYKEDELYLYADIIIEDLIRQQSLHYGKTILHSVEQIGGLNFYRYYITWKLDNITDNFVIDTYYGKYGKKYIFQKMFREIEKRMYENNKDNK